MPMHESGGMLTISLGFSTCGFSPSKQMRPTPDKQKSVCPTGWEFHAGRAPGVNVTTEPPSRRVKITIEQNDFVETRAVNLYLVFGAGFGNDVSHRFVVLVLKAEFRMSEDQALWVMMTAHQLGACVVAVHIKDVAEAKLRVQRMLVDVKAIRCCSPPNLKNNPTIVVCPRRRHGGEHCALNEPCV